MNPKSATGPPIGCRYQRNSLKTVNKNLGLISKQTVIKPRRHSDMEELVPVTIQDIGSSSDHNKDDLLQASVTLDSQNTIKSKLDAAPASPMHSMEEIFEDLKKHQNEKLVEEIETLKSDNGVLREKVTALIDESSDLKSRLANGKLGDLHVELASVKSKLKIAEAQKGEVKQSSSAKILKLEADKIIADREKLSLAEDVKRLRQELDELQALHKKLQTEHDAIKLDPEKVRVAAIRQLANKLLHQKETEPEIRARALEKCCTDGKVKFEKMARQQFIDDLSNALKSRTLKGFLDAHPGIKTDFDEQLLTLMRGDLELKARLQAQIKRELKDDAIKTQCDEILTKERASDLAARKIEDERRLAWDIKQRNLIDEKAAEAQKLYRENSALAHELRDMKKNRKRERSRSPSKGSRRR